MLMGMGLRGDRSTGIREMHSVVTGKVRLWKFSEVLLI